MALLEELGQALADVARRVGPSVVGVGGGWRGGSGVVIGRGVVLTNAHNVRGDELVVRFGDGRRAGATVTGIDFDGDLAILATDTGDSEPVAWSDSQPQVGTPVFAAAADGAGGRVTFGFVSSVARAFRGPRGRRVSGSVEHTAPLAPGSSGGPIVDADGRLMGINTNRLGNGFYLALPADDSLRQRIAALQRGESAERPRLGVGIAPAWVARRMRRAVGLADRDGVLVRDVENGSPAEAAGLAEGDLIIEAGGRAIREPDDVFDALGEVAAGSALKISYVRGTEERETEVQFGRATDGAAGPVH